MNTFEAFNQAIEEQKVKDEENRIRIDSFHAELKAKRDGLEKSLLERLMPFNEQIVVIGDKNKKLSVKLKEDKFRNAIQLYIDGNLQFEFFVKEQSSSCACESACDCETRYWHSVCVNDIKDDKRTGVYFDDGAGNVKTFAQSMVRLLDSTRWTR